MSGGMDGQDDAMLERGKGSRWMPGREGRVGMGTGDAVENRERPRVFGVGLAESEIAER